MDKSTELALIVPDLGKYPAKVGPGAESKISAEVLQKVAYALLKGVHREIAAKYAGISFATFKGWLARGRKDPDSPYGAFRRMVETIDSMVEIECVGVLSDFQAKDPKRIVEFLRRKYPERWGEDTRRVRELEREVKELKKLIDEYLNPGQEGAEAEGAGGPHARRGAAQPEHVSE